MRRNEIVVAEIGMFAIDTVDFLVLARTQRLVRIEAPDTLQKALPAQHLMTACDTAVEIIGDIEEGAVAIGDTGIQREKIGRNARLVARGLAGLELLDRAMR